MIKKKNTRLEMANKRTSAEMRWLRCEMERWSENAAKDMTKMH